MLDHRSDKCHRGANSIFQLVICNLGIRAYLDTTDPREAQLGLLELVLAQVLEQVLAQVLEQVLAQVLVQVLAQVLVQVLVLEQVLAQVQVLALAVEEVDCCQL